MAVAQRNDAVIHCLGRLVASNDLECVTVLIMFISRGTGQRRTVSHRTLRGGTFFAVSHFNILVQMTFLHVMQ